MGVRSSAVHRLHEPALITLCAQSCACQASRARPRMQRHLEAVLRPAPLLQGLSPVKVVAATQAGAEAELLRCRRWGAHPAGNDMMLRSSDSKYVFQPLIMPCRNSVPF